MAAVDSCTSRTSMMSLQNHQNDAIRWVLWTGPAGCAVADRSVALDALLTDLQYARVLLLSPALKTPAPPKSATMPSDQSVKSLRSTESSRSIRTIKAKFAHSPTKAFFSRMVAPLRLARSRSHRKKYDKIEESRLLPSPSASTSGSQRRASDDSDMTLVDPATAPEEVMTPASPLSANNLLEVLAPLIGALQGITPRLVQSFGVSDEVKREHAEICDKLVSFIEDLQETVQHRHQPGNPLIDSGGAKSAAAQTHDHDLEMTSLMLDALTKKIEKERSEVYRLSVVESYSETDESEWEETVVAEAELVQVKKGADGSPLLPSTKNPFVLHSTSVTLSARRGSESRPIPAGQTTGTGCSSFMGGVQPTWSRNVIRLGSYQNSFLFSPSPVAVQPMVGISQKL